MTTLTMYRGLPASGKTTAAEIACNDPNTIRVSKDDIRAARAKHTPGEVWTPDIEAEICQERDRQIRESLANGFSVISDDTNFNPAHEARLRQIARDYAVDFVVRDFPTDVEECVRRDAMRFGLHQVGEKVIRAMYVKYLETPPPPQPPARVRFDATLPWAIICDLDGTLSLSAGRRPWLDHTRCDEDDCNHAVRQLLDTYHRYLDDRIIYLTGREERFRPQTKAFMERNHCPPGVTLMRRNDDRRNNADVKRELFEQHIRGHYNVRFVLDDHPGVVAMFRARGVQAWQVADDIDKAKKSRQKVAKVYSEV